MHLPFSRTINHNLEVTLLHKKLEKEKWCFSQTRFNMTFDGWQEWERYYLPIELTGKTVLDVGAGEGETARFYLKHGAKDVICIEPDLESFKLLEANAQYHPLTVCRYPFFPELMSTYKYDFMKMDIEGYEEALLDVPPLKPSVVEIHGLQQIDKFRSKGWRVLEPQSRFSCVTYAYWRC